MEDCQDFLERLDVDMARNVLRYLDAPADLAHFAAVSRSWRKFVVESGCSKELCIRMFPEVSRFDCVIEMGKPMHSEGASSSKGIEWKNLEREHRVYTQLARNLMAPPADKGCIQQPISASSTDNFPDESIMPSYWSSEGKGNTEVPETLTYKLSSKLCMVHEVRIRPFQAYFQMGLPIYSTMFGHIYHLSSQCSSVCHAQVVGRPLSPALDFELDPREQYILKYSNKLERCDSLSEDSSRGSSEEDEASGPSGWHAFAERIRQIRAGRVLLWNRSILNTLLGNIAVANLMLPDDQESDEENDDDVLYE